MDNARHVLLHARRNRTIRAARAGAIITKLNNEIAAILVEPESAQRLAAEGAEPRPMSRAAFARVIIAEIEKWTRVAREANIRAE